MKVKICADAQSAGRAAAREVAGALRKNPGAVLGFATGHTMIPVYGELVRMHEDEGLSFKKATVINLDEYAGLSVNHHDSCFEFMNLRLLSQVDLPKTSFHIPRGDAPDLKAECERYEKLIREKGGIELQLLGLGRNGHIGFNEPGSGMDSRTRVLELHDVTRKTNSGDFRHLEDTPHQGITVGIGTILEARRIIMVVTGWEKADILAKVISSKPDPQIPASFLHTHPDVTLIADQQAMETYLQNQGEAGIDFVLGPK